jgi:hypothetical protein
MQVILSFLIGKTGMGICFEPEKILRTPRSLRPTLFPLTFWRLAALRLLKHAVKAVALHIAIKVIE